MAFWSGIFTSGGEELGAPVSGEAIALDEVEDEVFSRGMLGMGAAIMPEGGRLIAPCAGQIDTVFETGHALTMTTACGAQVLLHIGIDTVKLGGRHFCVHCAAGDQVSKGQLLMKFDPEAIAREGYDAVVVMTLPEGGDVRRLVSGRHVGEGETVILFAPR